MTYWNNRLCRDIDEQGNIYFSVREVFYNSETDEVATWTENPVTAVTESPEDTIHMLRMQLDDCLNRPILVSLEPEEIEIDMDNLINGNEVVDRLMSEFAADLGVPDPTRDRPQPTT